MSLNISDLQPSNVEIKIGNSTVTSKPVRLSHALILTQLGEIFQNPAKYSFEDIKKAETNIDSIFADLMPELTGTKLDMNTTINIISQLMDTIQPSDNQELSAKGVTFNNDPKATIIG
jgi:hypothetical protein